ncbi:transglycosylase SLT domain-containing protein [Bacillus safensis]|uniref:transglycosylase SLT domain-containing protein n=2 Tax=Bacillus safensis TaxID=561879 RepID=UPI00159BCDC5|nr:transglycosylase SLT domain-containing protein [Bacillus safensis]MCY7544554.1 transglycosylase SLT domain-containing protein [Bacillus safensis]MCY7642782.1 transglycosylase SLT domain-containing protein [Bacillus safensis]MEC3711449.1 transglycosylase SLT domain-containing protein [Bacillus safensis]MEC3755208.1 transglycosylase SLT domain-containing protein [Bacillus safensis]MED0907634.1 transglycosylase SLT domain-containing protein [Bacillus safensis]
MAKLTARFELEDRVSKKLLRIQKRFQTFEKQLKPFRKPVKISLEMDEKKLRNLTLSLRKVSVFSMRLDQGIYRDLKALNNQLNMIPNHLVISFQAKGLNVIKSNIDRLKQMGTSSIMLTFKLNDQLSAKMSSIKKSILQLINRTYYMRLNMVDQATAAIQRIKKTLKSLTMSKHEIRVSVQDNAKSKLKKRDQAESVVKEKKVKKQPNATAATKTNENKQSWLGNLGNKALKEIEKYAGDVSDKLKEKLSPRNFWDNNALPWIETKIDAYKQEVIGRISEKIKINPEEYLDKWFNKGLDLILGPKNQSSENNSNSSAQNQTTEASTNSTPNTQPNKQKGKGLFRNSCCPCCARGLSRRGSNRTRNRNGRAQRQPTNPTATSRAERNRRPPGRLGKLKTNAGKIFEKIPSGLKKTTGIVASVAGLAGLMKGSGGLSSLGDSLKNIGRGSSKLLKRVPVLGNLLSATDLIGTTKENVGEKVGGFSGGLAGGVSGAAIGQALIPIPFVGAAIGGVAGGMAGTFGGSKLGEIFDTSKLKENISNTLFNGEWWSEKWGSVKTSAETSLGNLSEKWEDIKTTASNTLFNSEWWAEQAGYVTGVLESTVFNGEWWSEKWDAIKDWTQEKWDSAVEIWDSIKRKLSETVFNGDWWGEKWDNVKEWTKEKWDGAVEIWDSIKGKLSETVFNGDWWGEKWDNVKKWTREKWDGAVDIWNSIKGKIRETVFNKDWWGEKWDNVKSWSKSKWEQSKTIWSTAKATISSTLFNKDWWSSKWSNVQSWGKNILGDSWDLLKSEGAKLVGRHIVKFEKGRENGKKDFKPGKKATGGYITQPTLSWVGEAGNEFVIPTQNNRGRGKMLLAQAASHLGMSVMPSGAAGKKQVSSSPAPTTASSSVGSMSGGGSVSMNANIQASSIGEQFNDDFEQGLNRKVISLDQWKQKNIQQPFGQLTSDSGKYGQQTVSAFANGQQMTPTGTDSFLQSRVKAPYQQVMTASPTWGSGTVSGFAAGQNATSIGTSQYVDQNIKQPFLQAKQESPGWGSGMIDAFNSGMRSKGSEVTQAAKEMAKKVEQAFREELDIHSPSRVMMSLGKFASIGVVKGLDSVDVKKFAENQAGSLIGAFSGMGASGLNIKQWLMAAIMATGTSMSWLPGLMTIAQHESRGNPRAINLWDSNAKKGTPSKGLMQTIGTTFNANKGKGMNDIWNPIHNAVAAINYIKGRYGTVFNTPGLRSMRRGGPYKGYANGGLITQEQVARVGEGNKREWIIPEERGIRGRYLLTQAAKALGMQVYDPSNASAPLPEAQMQQVTSAQSTGSTTSSGNKQITIQFNGDQHFHNGQDQQSLVEKIKQMLVDELEVELHTGTKGVVIDG